MAFVKTKNCLVATPILSQPYFFKKFTIQCDASSTGVGGVLNKIIDNGERVIADDSRSLSKFKRK